MVTEYSPRILVINQPRSYRETVAVALGMLCQHAHVMTADPEDVERTLLTHRPHVVVCSEVTPMIERHAPNWVSIYPEGEATAMRCTGGRKSRLPDIDLKTLAMFVNEVAPPGPTVYQ